MDPFKAKNEIVDSVNRLKAVGKISVYKSRVEIHGINRERYDWGKLIASDTERLLNFFKFIRQWSVESTE